MRPSLLMALAVALLTLLISPLFGERAHAQTKPVLVELFTSQGCSSCPPADSYLGELAASDDVIALAYHVDYWDYLGWKDTFAKPAYTLRQRTYSLQVNRQYIGSTFAGIFTPEAVVQGTDSLIGSSRETIAARVAAHQAAPIGADLALTREGENLNIRVSPAPNGSPKARIMVATYLPEAKVDVRRGENAGRQLTYHHVVTSLTHAGDWNGKDTVDVRMKGVNGAAVVFLQGGGAGPVLAVAQSDG